jgi:hypothetical protein
VYSAVTTSRRAIRGSHFRLSVFGHFWWRDVCRGLGYALLASGSCPGRHRRRRSGRTTFELVKDKSEQTGLAFFFIYFERNIFFKK